MILQETAKIVGEHALNAWFQYKVGVLKETDASLYGIFRAAM
jgi:hypothetical protein